MLVSEETLAAYVARHRKALGFSQRELSEMIGKSHSYIERLEQGLIGDPRGQTLRALAEALKCPPGEILSLQRGPPEIHREDIPEWARSAFDKIMAQPARDRPLLLRFFREWWAEEQERQRQEAERERFRGQQEDERQRKEGENQTG